MAGAGARTRPASPPEIRCSAGAVHLDEVVRALGDREHVEGLAAGGQPDLEPAGAVDVDFDRTAVEYHLVSGRAAPGHPEFVGLAAHPDVDLVPGLVTDLGASALGRGEQPVLLAPLVRLVGLEGGGQQGHVDRERP